MALVCIHCIVQCRLVPNITDRIENLDSHATVHKEMCEYCDTACWEKNRARVLANYLQLSFSVTRHRLQTPGVCHFTDIAM